VIIGLLIIKTAFELLRKAVNDVIGTRADQEIIDKLKSKISSYE
jgi:divalent metal cation (Fe/Co/Zn/Cd) transporter